MFAVIQHQLKLLKRTFDSASRVEEESIHIMVSGKSGGFKELATLQEPSGDRLGGWLPLFTFLFCLVSSACHVNSLIHDVNVLIS